MQLAIPKPGFYLEIEQEKSRSRTNIIECLKLSAAIQNQSAFGDI